MGNDTPRSRGLSTQKAQISGHPGHPRRDTEAQTPLARRIRQVMGDIKFGALAKIMGVGSSSARNYWDGTPDAPAKVIARLAEHTGRTCDWFILGEERETTQHIAEGEATYRILPRIWLPVIGRAAAGQCTGSLRDLESPEGYYESDGPRATVEIIGQSLEPIAWPGQHVIVDMSERSARDGDLVIARTKDGRTLAKRFFQVGDQVLLVPVRREELKTQAPVVLARDAIEDLRIMVGVLFE